MKKPFVRCIAVLSLAAATVAGAQTFPAKPIRWIVPVSYTHLTLPTIYSV